MPGDKTIHTLIAHCRSLDLCPCGSSMFEIKILVSPADITDLMRQLMIDHRIHLPSYSSQQRAQAEWARPPRLSLASPLRHHRTSKPPGQDTAAAITAVIERLPRDRVQLAELHRETANRVQRP
jgi:hypothetical protein